MTQTYTSAVSQMRAVAQNQGPSTTSDGQLRDLLCDRLGGLFATGWKERLILGGYGEEFPADDLTIVVEVPRH